MVSEYRNIPLDKVRELADGSTLNGTRAKDLGLVDEVGGRVEAKAALAKILNKEPDDIIFCEYTSTLLPF
jgi:protease-4